jgi:hypothetical protein
MITHEVLRKISIGSITTLLAVGMLATGSQSNDKSNAELLSSVGRPDQMSHQNGASFSGDAIPSVSPIDGTVYYRVSAPFELESSGSGEV